MTEDAVIESLRAVNRLLSTTDVAALHKEWGSDRLRQVTDEMANLVALYIEKVDVTELRTDWCATLGARDGEALFGNITRYVWRDFPSVLQHLLWVWRHDTMARERGQVT